MGSADPELFARVQDAAGGSIRLVTVAPEIEGVLPLIEKLVRDGILVALGHTAADTATIRKAVDAGASLSTHLGNGTAGALAKNNNPIMAQLGEDRLHASFIADGYHLSPEVLNVYLRAKQTQRTILVTDAMAGAAAPPGRAPERGAGRPREFRRPRWRSAADPRRGADHARPPAARLPG